MLKLILFGSIVILGISSCGSDDFGPPCDKSGSIAHRAENWDGTIEFLDDYGYAIYYLPPGSFEVIYTGVICNILPDEFKQDGLKITFSGNFIDDEGEIQPVGGFIVGQQFFFLNWNILKQGNKSADP